MEIILLIMFLLLSAENVVLLRAIEKPRREAEADRAVEEAMEKESEESWKENESNKAFQEGVENIMSYTIDVKRGDGE